MDIKVGDKFRYTKAGTVYTVMWVNHTFCVVCCDDIGLPQTHYKSNFGSDRDFIPIPPFVEGDRVQFAPYTVPAGRTGTVLGLWEDRAWVILDGQAVPISPLIINLFKAENPHDH